ncbi:MAG TPA: SIR2 family protein [Symbiobacteriaceae bacterium]|jgi:hypothetical protein
MINFIDFFPKPLLVDLCEGEVLPFIGAGFSKNANIPPGRIMPDFSQVAACLQEMMPDYRGNSTLDIVSEFDARFGRAQLAEEYYKMLLVGLAKPGPTHREFARLPFDIVGTTNFDQLLEDGYQEVNRFPQVVMFEDQLPVHDTVDDPVMLLKIHGDVNFPNRMITTEQDYDTFIARYPLYVTYLASLLITRTALFIGYSLDDYDFRSIWDIIGDRLGRLRRQAYAIEVGADASIAARYERRGVHLINLPGERSDFPIILTQTFLELRAYLATQCPPSGVPDCAALRPRTGAGPG